MRQYIIAGNWKMNKTVSESVELAKAIVEAVKEKIGLLMTKSDNVKGGNADG